MQSLTPARPYKRRQFWIDGGFQGRIVSQLVTVAVASIFCSHLVTLAYVKVREMLGASGGYLIYFSNQIEETLTFTHFFDMLLPPLLISAAVGTLLVVVMGIFYSHRIAGPLFNLKRTMKLVGTGNLNARLHIRKNDEFHDVEQSFNAMMDGWKQHMEKVEQTAKKLKDPKKDELIKLLEAFHTAGEETRPGA